ncbi:MAG: DUF1566 domain-containing protein [Acidobacteria bacterium]|nr:DUF1566 domain-containing protein [Acidobacteriota bacterium]
MKKTLCFVRGLALGVILGAFWVGVAGGPPDSPAADVREGNTSWSIDPAASGPRAGGASGCFTCNGTLSPGGRWCDNGDGTVTDMSTGLVWLKDASFVPMRVIWLPGEYPDCALSIPSRIAANSHSLKDGSRSGEWRLPTVYELRGLAHGDEAVRSDNMYFFLNVQPERYWTITTFVQDFFEVYCFDMANGETVLTTGNHEYFIWLVRNRR